MSQASGPYRNYAAIDGTNPAAIKAAEAWANPSGLNTHYNRYFLIGNNLEVPKEELVEDEAVNEQASYQLILDEDYIFDWESAVHSDIPLYGNIHENFILLSLWQSVKRVII